MHAMLNTYPTACGRVMGAARVLPAVVLGLFLGLGLALASPAALAADDCEGYSQADRLVCLRHAATASEGELAQARKALLTAIAQWDESAKYQAIARRQLSAADRAFAAHRVAHCDLHKSLGGGAIGSGLEMRRLVCVAATNAARTAQLRQMAERLEPR